MARRIIWTKAAQKSRRRILEYWVEKNQTKSYSHKLNDLIIQSLKLISVYPNIGKPTNIRQVRIKVIKKYFLIYEVTRTEIVVLTLWDCRQNPEDLKRILGV